MKIIAHRGYSSKFPDNSIRAFLEAKNAGADGFECDIWFKLSGKPVVTHNVYSFGASTLEEVLKFVAREKFPVYLHLKIVTKRNLKKVLVLIKQTNTKDLAKIMISARDAKRLGAKNGIVFPFFRYPFFNIQEYIEKYTPEKVVIFAPRRMERIVNLENIKKKAGENNVKLSLGIFNTKKSVKWALGTGISEIWTNDPRLIKLKVWEHK